MLITARMMAPAQYFARLMRPSNDVNKYWKSKFIVPPPYASGLLPAVTFVEPKGC
jgi:hypothetical protein